MQLLGTDLESLQSKRSLLPFLGDALKLLTGTATTGETWKIKQHVNQLKQAQTKQQQTLVHVLYNNNNNPFIYHLINLTMSFLRHVTWYIIITPAQAKHCVIPL